MWLFVRYQNSIKTTIQLTINSSNNQYNGTITSGYLGSTVVDIGIIPGSGTADTQTAGGSYLLTLNASDSVYLFYAGSPDNMVINTASLTIIQIALINLIIFKLKSKYNI